MITATERTNVVILDQLQAAPLLNDKRLLNCGPKTASIAARRGGSAQGRYGLPSRKSVG